mmetsp:Transcript_54508/g.151966  ORF Transcript_54508/g.151966 Transcript_54508/m.151966 type:complete len:242 (-) Transcript_54508:22-747(-)
MRRPRLRRGPVRKEGLRRLDGRTRVRGRHRGAQRSGRSRSAAVASSDAAGASRCWHCRITPGGCAGDQRGAHTSLSVVCYRPFVCGHQLGLRGVGTLARDCDDHRCAPSHRRPECEVRRAGHNVGACRADRAGSEGRGVRRPREPTHEDRHPHARRSAHPRCPGARGRGCRHRPPGLPHGCHCPMTFSMPSWTGTAGASRKPLRSCTPCFLRPWRGRPAACDVGLLYGAIVHLGRIYQNLP